MEKSQSPAQQQAQQQTQSQSQQPQQMPLQITQEQFQQLQQFQIQQAFANSQPATIHVKQEYATQQQQQQGQGISAADLKTLQDQQNQMNQMQILQESPQSPHQNNQNALQQVPAEWQHGRVQVLQQPLQNAQYLPQMYSPQLVMSGGLLHGGIGQQQIQLIAAGKPFPNQLTQQMMTAGGKSVLTSGGQTSFGGYTLPTIPSSQAQTVLFSPVTLNGVLNSQQQQAGQQNILPSMQSQSTPTKSDQQKQMSGQKILQKVSQSGTAQQQQTLTQTVANHQQQQANQQCVQVSQTMPTAQLLNGQTMQFTQWPMQGMTPFWTNAGIQPQTLLTSSPILFRGTNPDGTPGVFIQQSPTQTTQAVQSPHNQISLVGNITQAATQKVRPASDALQQKTQQGQQRAAPILPQGAPIRPASSVSTQTAMNQNANLLAKPPKVRTKQTPVRPAAPNIKVSLNQQTGQPMMQQVVTPGGVNKMVVMSNINGQFTPVLQQNAAQQILANDKLKNQQQQQQVILQQAMANMQQNAVHQQQAQLQQQIAQIQMQQQQHQFLQQSQNAAQLMAQSGNIQQVVLQHSQQLPTVTVSSGSNLQQSMQSHLAQQGIMTKAGSQQVIQMQPVSSQTVSVPTSMANTQMVSSMSGSTDTSNSILGPLSSPQTPLQPPQNPLIAMTTLSASPMSNVGMQKDKNESNDSNQKSNQSMSVTLSPMKRPAEDVKQNEAKKQATEESKKTEDFSNRTASSPSVNKTSSAPGTPNSSNKGTVNSPLAAQNGESDTKKTTPVNTPMLKNELPKAMVKPLDARCLTHVIEGFVIQESNEPFPVTCQRYSEKENDVPPMKKQKEEDSKANEAVKVNGEVATSTNVTSSTVTQTTGDKISCEHCGEKIDKNKAKKKRFCSLLCARARKSGSTDASPNVSILNGDEKSQIAQSPSLNDKPKMDGENGEALPTEEHVMLKWSVAQVCDFIKNLPGCTDYAEDFKLQEIDGQALLLLKENHLVSAMGMKLGPALKIVSKIESMRVSKEGDSTETPPEQQ